MTMFCSWMPSPLAFAVDALSVSWENMEAYAFPPIALIPKVLQHMKKFHCQLILIAPQWPRRHWYTDLLQMLVACPRQLPVIQDLLYQPQTKLIHPNPQVFKLVAWLLSTDPFKIKDFQQTLGNSWKLPGDLGHRDYAAKFNKFSGWCSEREINPYTATVTQCAEFLSFLFHSGLKYRTIAGYRSMLSVVLSPADGMPVGQHPDILRLLKGVFNSRPPEKKADA